MATKVVKTQSPIQAEVNTSSAYFRSWLLSTMVLQVARRVDVPKDQLQRLRRWHVRGRHHYHGQHEPTRDETDLHDHEFWGRKRKRRFYVKSNAPMARTGRGHFGAARELSIYSNPSPTLNLWSWTKKTQKFKRKYLKQLVKLVQCSWNLVGNWNRS